jgi:membrane protein DedA with SNARE-associated domain
MPVPANKRAARLLNVVVGTVLAIVLLGTVLEAALDYLAVSLDVATVAQTFMKPEVFGVGLVAIEEAGLPLPISGDLLIMYSASRAGPSLSAWLVLGLGFEISVLIGSTFLFFVARRWGARLLLGSPGRALGLSPERIERVEGWFKRWGIWAVIFGRHVPGFRVAVTVVAASFQLSYRVFIIGVAISAAVWVSLFMTLGLLVGPQVAQLLGTHQNSSLLILLGVLLVVIAYVAWRMTSERRRRPAP